LFYSAHRIPIAPRARHLNGYLTGREFLLDTFTDADAYLFTVLNWSMATPVSSTVSRQFKPTSIA
jgi:hypothetical protein